MSLQVIGAGVGRTATMSLKAGLERLLGGPCYHMFEVFQHPEHVPLWHRAVKGEPLEWSEIFDGYVAAVDWPVGSFWKELIENYPDALVVLSVRDPESWWESASETIFPTSRSMMGTKWYAMMMDLFDTRFTSALENRDACIAAFEKHNDEVRRTVPSDRLVEWRAKDGWAPLCDALGMPVPAGDFPRVNTREDFQFRDANPNP